jgi:hypothetical protein
LREQSTSVIVIIVNMGGIVSQMKVCIEGEDRIKLKCFQFVLLYHRMYKMRDKLSNTIIPPPLIY